jgi:hypothetical protein
VPGVGASYGEWAEKRNKIYKNPHVKQKYFASPRVSTLYFCAGCAIIG